MEEVTETQEHQTLYISNLLRPLLVVSTASKSFHDGQDNIDHFLEHLHGGLQFSKGGLIEDLFWPIFFFV